MKNPFKQTGFDSVISKNTVINGALTIKAGETVVLNGSLSGQHIVEAPDELLGASVSEKPCTLIVNGSAEVSDTIVVSNLVITGNISCNLIIATKSLSIKNGARVKANLIHYRNLTIESAAEIDGRLIKIKDSENVQQDTK